MTNMQMKGALEAILFAMGDSVPLDRLAEAIGMTSAETGKLLAELKESYESEERGIRLLELEGSYQLTTKKEYFANLITIASHPVKPVLTDVVMETLSIIAYKQPVTRGEIEKIRGVSCSHAINKLVEYDLIQEVGRLDAPGKPILFGTTETFLRNFGIDSTENLPDMNPVQLEDFRAEAEAEIPMGI